MKNKLIFFATMLLSGLCIQASFQGYLKIGYIETALKYIPVYSNTSDADGSLLGFVEKNIGILKPSTKSIYVDQSYGVTIITQSTTGESSLRY